MQAHRLEIKLKDVDEPFDEGNVLHCDTWCRRYFHASEQSALLRFNIGVYQIYQAMKAGNDEERLYTSHASVMIHVLSALHGTVQDVDALRYLPRFWHTYLGSYAPTVLPYKLETVAALTQQHCYVYTTLPGSIRRTRIDPVRLSALTAELCMQAISQIPASRRAWAIGIEMERLTSFEWKSK